MRLYFRPLYHTMTMAERQTGKKVIPTRLITRTRDASPEIATSKSCKDINVMSINDGFSVGAKEGVTAGTLALM